MARSNRPLTQFAVQKLRSFLDDGAAGFKPGASHNTAVSYSREHDYNVLAFWLFDQRIMEITLEGEHVLEVTILDGGTYDNNGNPTKTTRERLNGLLDTLGAYCLIPEGVRVFVKEDRCYVGLGSVVAPLGKGYQPPCIESNATKLEFLA